MHVASEVIHLETRIFRPPPLAARMPCLKPKAQWGGSGGMLCLGLGGCGFD